MWSYGHMIIWPYDHVIIWSYDDMIILSYKHCDIPVPWWPTSRYFGQQQIRPEIFVGRFFFSSVRPSVRPKFFRPSVQNFSVRPSVRPKIFRPSVRKFSVRPKFFRPSENFPSVCERICFYIKLSPHTSIYLINFSQPNHPVPGSPFAESWALFAVSWLKSSLTQNAQSCSANLNLEIQKLWFNLCDSTIRFWL